MKCLKDEDWDRREPGSNPGRGSLLGGGGRLGQSHPFSASPPPQGGCEDKNRGEERVDDGDDEGMKQKDIYR